MNCDALAADAPENPEDQAKRHADQDRAAQREVEREVRFADGDIAWEMPQWKVEAIERQKDGSDDDQQEPNEDEGAAEVGHRTVN